MVLPGGVTRRTRGAQCPERRITGCAKNPNNAESTFFITVHLLTKYLIGSNMGDTKFVPCPGRHLNLVRPCF